MEKFIYSGNELNLFSSAKNWKSYWAHEIQPFLGESVLEIGAGIGSTVRTLEYKKYKTWVCLEPDEKLFSVIQREMKYGRLPGNLKAIQGTSSILNYRDKFDTILYIDVLEHIKDDKNELKQIQKKLSRGGKIIILSPAHNFLYSKFDEEIGHFRRYNKAMLRSVVPEGLQIKKICYLDSVGLLANLANKLLLRTKIPTYSQIQFWDKFMVPISRLIDSLIGYNFGKSIFCVLKK